MSDYLFLMESRLSPQQWQAVGLVEKTAAAVGINVYVCGGAIRDLVAGLPIEDLDFIAEGKALKLAKELERRGAQVIWENPKLQAAEMELPGGVLASVSMARSETYPKAGGAPVIAPAPIVVDLKRRDFAMNAIAVSLASNSRGLLLDPANGVADIEKREIRSLNPYGFLDDPARLFRAVRLRARLQFTFDPKTAVQFQNARAADILDDAPGESLALEIRQWAREPHPVAVLRALEKEKLLAAVSPRLQGAGIDWQSIAKTSKASHALALMGLRAPSFPLFLHQLTRKLPARDKAALLKRLQIRAGEAALPLKLEAGAKKLAKELQGSHANSPTKIYQMLSKAAPDLLLLLLTGAGNAKAQARLKAYLEKYLPLRSRLPHKEAEAQGVSAGSPRMTKILDAYFYASIEGKLRTPAQEQKFLAQQVKQIK